LGDGLSIVTWNAAGTELPPVTASSTDLLPIVVAEAEKEVEREIAESEKELAHDYNARPLDFNLTDLDKWADENLAPIQCDAEALDRWIAETEKNGFRYR
jgi:hypothetical protein